MPWSVGDVNRFKKGLSEKQKKKWVSIANGVLRDCRQDNGSNCEEKAIRTANSRLSSNMSTQTINRQLVIQSVATADYEIRTEMHNGAKHLVVPVVMMREGVHNGSGGSSLHYADELGRVPGSWNGIPVIINHPQEGNNFVSANSPKWIETAVGRVFNTFMDGDKLRGEAWLDEDKLKATSMEAFSHIMQKRPVDVSVGVFTDNEPEEGEWNGEHYTYIAHNHRPDHLALLPGGVGACSWQDGCGIRVNSSNNNLNVNGYEMNVNELDLKGKLNMFKELLKENLAVTPIVNQTGLVEVLGKVREKLDSMDNDASMFFLEELYDDKVIYRARNMQRDTNTLYQQSYTIGQDGTVEFSGEPKEVRKSVEYQTLGMKRTKFNSKKEDKMNVNERVEQLIANTNSKFTNCDREWLQGLSEEALTKLEPKKQEQLKEPTLDANTAFEFLKKNKPETDKVLELLSDEEKTNYQKGLEFYKKQRTDLIQSITANTDQWKEEDLKDMDFGMLEKLSKTVTPKKPEGQEIVDYSGQGAGGYFSANTEDDMLLPTGVQLGSKKQ